MREILNFPLIFLFALVMMIWAAKFPFRSGNSEIGYNWKVCASCDRPLFVCLFVCLFMYLLIHSSYLLFLLMLYTYKVDFWVTSSGTLKC